MAFWSTSSSTVTREVRATVVQDTFAQRKAAQLVTWNARGMPIRIVSPMSFVKEFNYVYNPIGGIVEYEEHYSTGRVYKCAYALNRLNEAVSVHCISGDEKPVLDASIKYSSKGRIKRMVISYHDSTIVDALLHKAQGTKVPITAWYKYRHKRNRMYEVNMENGRRYMYTFDEKKRLTGIHYGDDKVLECVYDSCGGLASSRMFQQGTGTLIEEYIIQRTSDCVLAGIKERSGSMQEFTSFTVKYE